MLSSAKNFAAIEPALQAVAKQIDGYEFDTALRTLGHIQSQEPRLA